MRDRRINDTRNERFAGAGGAVQWTNYLFAGGERIGMRVERDGEAPLVRYFHSDHLGSAPR